MRKKDMGGDAVMSLPRVGLSENQIEEMYRYLAIADYEDRYVIPTSHQEALSHSFDDQGSCGFSADSRFSEGVTSASVFAGKARTNAQLISVDEIRRGSRRT
jgi:nitrate reductase beta subunit